MDGLRTRTVLIVDDDEDAAMLIGDGLRRRQFDVHVVNSGAACLEYLRFAAVDVVVTDLQMPGMSGVELCKALGERHPDALAVMLTGFGTFEVAVGAIRAGVYDFLLKPVKIDALVLVLERALEHLALRREVTRLRGAADLQAAVPGMIGSSSAIREVCDLIRRVAPSDATVLIAGESGTGKELVARALHQLSARRDAPFVAVNCGAMPAPLLESELFGHVRGAFTDAKRSRAGLFVQATGGTIFLDEIGEMPMEMQVKLLRVLQERTARPVGSDEETPFETRVITATNRDLETAVDDKRFREDLFHRINVVAIPVPPLRARAGDVMELANSFLERALVRNTKRATGISRDAAQKLLDYDWPGNVRELENCIERAVAMCTTTEIQVIDLPVRIQRHECKRLVLTTEPSSAELLPLEEVERRYVRHILDAVGGNKTHAARILGIDRRSLYRRLEPASVDSKSGKLP